MDWAEKEISPQTKKKIILEQVSIMDVLSHYKIEHATKMICPFPDHNDGIASFVIYAETNSFYCFGCNRGSNVIDFVMMMEGCSFVQAIDKLMLLRGKDKFNIQPPKDYKDIYSFNMACDLRDFLQSVKEYHQYEREKNMVDNVFGEMDKKLEQTDKEDEKALKNMRKKIAQYIKDRKEILMDEIDGYNRKKL